MKNTELIVAQPAILARVQAEVDGLNAFLSAATAPSTRRAYASDWRQFTAWCLARHLESLPAKPETVALYLTSLAQSGRKVATIARARAAIAVAHEAAKLDSPSGTLVVKSAMKGIRNTLGVAPKKKKPILVEDLDAMLDAAPATMKGVRDMAILAIGFTIGCRRSELVAICVEHLTFDKRGIALLIPKSKTDQEGKGRFVGIPRQEEGTCPCALLEEWLRKAKIKNGPVFRAVRGNSIADTKLSADAVAQIVKDYAKLIGADAKDFAGHSLRRGFITQAIRDGKHERSIMKQTGHHSTAVFRGYIEENNVFDDNAASDIWRKR